MLLFGIGNCWLKIADFGIAKQFDGMTSAFSTKIGNVFWMAPETNEDIAGGYWVAPASF